MGNVTSDVSAPRFFTTQQLADLFGIDVWRVQRIFENGDVPEPARFAGKRAIPSHLLPHVVDALRAHAWLPASSTAEVSG